MSRYKPFYQKDAETFLRLYKKYLEHQYEMIYRVFEEIPTDVIEKVFNETDIHKNEDKLFIDYGFKHIADIALQLEYCYKLYLEGKLSEKFSKIGININESKIGARKNE